MQKFNRLNNQRVYLAGAIDRVADRGAGWRELITPFLQELGIKVFNPLKKPTGVGLEDDEVHSIKIKLRKELKYDELANIMKTIRAVDLRMVDISDFLVVNLNIEHHACGTYEEIALANRSKKPILIHVEQGKDHTPDWLFGTIPHDWFFSNWDDLRKYLIHVNEDKNINLYKRWQFFNI
jgi:nucleoside 2-deoxyribosyltransferase